MCAMTVEKPNCIMYDDVILKLERSNERCFSKIIRGLELRIPSMIEEIVLKNFSSIASGAERDANAIMNQISSLPNEIREMESRSDVHCSLEQFSTRFARDLDKISAANEKLAREIECMEDRISKLIGDLTVSKSTVCAAKANETIQEFVEIDDSIISRPIKEILKRSAYQLSFDDISRNADNLLQEIEELSQPIGTLSDSLVTLDETGAFNSESVSETHADRISGISSGTSEPFSDNIWIYVASADADFCKSRLQNHILWTFGMDDLKIDLLSKNKDVTYQSFKILVPSVDAATFLCHKKWPKSYYVRRFDEKKRSGFPSDLPKDQRRIKRNFVHNPLKLRI